MDKEKALKELLSWLDSLEVVESAGINSGCGVAIGIVFKYGIINLVTLEECPKKNIK